MYYYEVLIADSKYHSSSALIYSSEESLQILSIVTVPLRQRLATGFIIAETGKPNFTVKAVKALISKQPLPSHSLPAAQWIASYYCSTIGEALRQFAPSKPSVRKQQEVPATGAEPEDLQLELASPLTPDQQQALSVIRKNPSTTILLHGDTGTGKTRVYLELAKEVLAAGRSVILLTPEISLTAQLLSVVKQSLRCPVFVLHSQLTVAQRKKVWMKILEATEPVAVVGPRSALFAPITNPGLIIVDEAHEPSYKQDQSPSYSTVRVASQIGALTGAKVVLGTATPAVEDYFLATEKKAVVRMTQPARGITYKITTEVIDMKNRSNFTKNPYLSNQFIDAIKKTLSANKQMMVYLNRRGSARLILCSACGWQLLCPNCDIPLVYHGDEHLARCHTCGITKSVPTACPDCRNSDIIYRSIGTKALTESLHRLFPNARINRFDSDNALGERLDELYEIVRSGEIDILVGTQLLAKGLDL
ncbi:MAG: primosomal protein N', partial [Candidatus Saccharimonadales bacterium]